MWNSLRGFVLTVQGMTRIMLIVSIVTGKTLSGKVKENTVLIAGSVLNRINKVRRDMNVLVFIPGLAMLLFTVFEMPGKVKKQFFKVPVWVSSSAIAVLVGMVGRGVLGPTTGFVTELILFPGLHLAKGHYYWLEKRKIKKQGGKNEGVGFCDQGRVKSGRSESM